MIFFFLDPESSDVVIGCYPEKNDCVEVIWDGKCGIVSVVAFIFQKRYQHNQITDLLVHCIIPLLPRFGGQIP